MLRPSSRRWLRSWTEALEQERHIAKAACLLADRYRAERDGARAATEATKSKALDAALFGNDVRSAIAKALSGEPNTVGDAIDRDSPEAAARLAKTVPLMFQRPADQVAKAINPDGSAVKRERIARP